VKEGHQPRERCGADARLAVSTDGLVALNLIDRHTRAAVWRCGTTAGLTRIGHSVVQDVPYVSWFAGDLCESMSSEEIEAQVGMPPLEIFDMSDDGSILVGRSGSFFTGFDGALWIERIGWMTWDDFFR
jgi:hypothetical protein